MKYTRYFTNEKRKPIDYFEWEKSNIDITDDEGKILFIQKDVEFPSGWSHLARKIVGSKYFYGEQETSKREYSAKQLTKRVSATFKDWALKQGYFSSKKEAEIFEDELAYLALDQRMAFNSPVWFNVGVHRIEKEKSDDRREAYIVKNKGEIIKMPKGREKEYPQTSACFIQHVDDTMEGIMQLAVNEARLFKYGSGTGTDLSTLRSSREKLSGGGKPSGPLAYWEFYDKVAGIVKSGGKTRRAAKMNSLKINHPDIYDFIESKRKEEEKAHILIDNGVNPRDALDTVAFQNTNISIRVSDKFMEDVREDKEWQTIPVHNKDMADKMPKYKAKELFKKIAEGTHFCGDPGMQFDDIMNNWHTCPNSERQNATNPCSEYSFIDDSSCNLASQNLLKFLNKSGTFDIEGFSSALRTTAIAQDLEIDNSSYPTKKIAENSHKFRPLGMGYANLGSLVMALGLPYDSGESRSIAGAITALLTGKVYETSTEMAQKIGTFQEFEKNKKPMLKVMEMHRNALKNINRKKIPKGLENILDEAKKTWDNVIEKGGKYGFRNAQATVLAPTGTIGFMMDCDTKGVEPEIGLVQTKLLSDGGTLRLTNNTVKLALKKLRYNDVEINNITNYIDKNETIEGAPNLKDKHLAVFDCANKPKNGKRTISYRGHLEMMAAVQPFISGAISKTVNLPEEATVEEIENVYMDAWKLGLKSVVLYRDGSKKMQPLSFSKDKTLKPIRRKLPKTRGAIVHKFDIAGHEGYLTIGKYPDGNPGEVFINMSKEGSTVGGLMDGIGILTSIALQYGVPLDTLSRKFRHQKFEPRGLVHEGHPDIKLADSVTDYIFNYLGKEFFDHEKDRENNIKPEVIETDKQDINLEGLSEEEKGGFCAICGTQAIKKGHCNEVCPKCDWINPKGCGE
ncbi:ribonucleoside-diphosphate reductase, adenosylcobalamin-dependent [Candidatus Pacearchaeota archaeon]|nr:ribonucleoside-diphosphate reductase, adenosylcobalamin-dependent [Candidatus Pacearchaeota archaeon]